MGLILNPSGKTSFEDSPPNKIVSLCPPLTETLFDFGLRECVVGVSKQCRFPEVRVKAAVSLGSNRRPDLNRIRELNPDLIVLDSRETDASVVKLLKEEFPVWDSNTTTILESITEIRDLGTMTGKSANAEWIAGKIETRFLEFQATFKKPERPRSVAFLANYKPWSAFGANTLAHELLSLIGLENVFSNTSGVYPIEQKKLPGVSTIILLAEGVYSFHKRHLPVVNRKFPDSPSILVREDLLTWYGSRLLRTPLYLSELHQMLAKL